MALGNFFFFGQRLQFKFTKGSTRKRLFATNPRHFTFICLLRCKGATNAALQVAFLGVLCLGLLLAVGNGVVGIFPQEFLDCFAGAVTLVQNGGLLVVAGEEVESWVASDVDVLRRVVQRGVHLANDQVGSSVGLEFLITRHSGGAQTASAIAGTPVPFSSTQAPASYNDRTTGRRTRLARPWCCR